MHYRSYRRRMQACTAQFTLSICDIHGFDPAMVSLYRWEYLRLWFCCDKFAKGEFLRLNTKKYPLSKRITDMINNLSYCRKTLLKVCNYIINIFQTDRKTNKSAVNTCCDQLFICKLTMCCRCRVKHTGTDISYVNFI